MIRINYSYYNNESLLKFIVNYYQSLDCTDYVFSICDDGSQEQPIDLKLVPKDWIVYRVNEDIGWNVHGVKNLLMKETNTKWNVIIDIDRVISPQSLQYIRQNKLDEDELHHFAKLPNDSLGDDIEFVVDRKSDNYHCAIASFIITKELFWSKNGYHENVHQRNYGGDFTFLHHFKPWIMNPHLYCFDVIHHATYDSEWKKQSIKNYCEQYKDDVTRTKDWGFPVEPDDGKRVNFKWERIQ